MEQALFLTGKILLAMPGIGDPRFEKAVIALCSHDERGALGIGIGRIQPNVSLHDLLDQFDIDAGAIPDAPVHMGGPVEPQRGFVLHTPDWGGQDTLDVAGKWCLSSTLDVLKAIATGVGPSRWLVALGYAGWGVGQLEGEMRRHGWHLDDGDAGLLFNTSYENRWEACFRHQGIDPQWLASGSGSA